MTPRSPGPPNQPKTFWAPWAKKITPRKTRTMRRGFEAKVPKSISMARSSGSGWDTAGAAPSYAYARRLSTPAGPVLPYARHAPHRDRRADAGPADPHEAGLPRRGGRRGAGADRGSPADRERVHHRDRGRVA